MYAVFSSTGTQGKSTQDFRRFATRLVITADAWFSPRHANALPMTCSGSSPFSYQLRFTPNLQPVDVLNAASAKLFWIVLRKLE